MNKVYVCRMVDKMTVDKIKPGHSYMSIHYVPYLVLAITDETITARCLSGRGSKNFKMPAEQFAAAMDRTN